MRHVAKTLLFLVCAGALVIAYSFFSSHTLDQQLSESAQVLTLRGETHDQVIEADLLQSEYGVSFMHVSDNQAKKLLRQIEKGHVLHYIGYQGVPEEYKVKDVIVSTRDELDLSRWGYQEKSLLLINSSLPLVNGLTNADSQQYLYVSVIAEKADTPLLAGNVDATATERQGRFLWDVFL